MSWIEAKVLKNKWSFDAAVGYAMRNSLFVRNEMVCTKTLYNYLHQGLLRVKAMDLPGIIRQSQKKRHTREHKRKLGKSIDLRDKSIDSRKEFGHWELDTVRGIKNRNDQVLVSYSPGERGSNERHNELLLRKVRLLKMYPKLLYNVPLIGVTIYLASCYITKHHKKSLLKKLIRLWI